MFGIQGLDQKEQTVASTNFKKQSIRKTTMDQKEETELDQVLLSATQTSLTIKD